MCACVCAGVVFVCLCVCVCVLCVCVRVHVCVSNILDRIERDFQIFIIVLHCCIATAYSFNWRYTISLKSSGIRNQSNNLLT